ncbi:GTPase IMAP family member 4 [Holothuria leucospilota]|uniref:GTPase IMAP family member 4 n=1 Tax=Holothuria leucospilota TaxID=206669 RepID=A0A9Q1H5A4_HOLLE|nr:GTPase IMAP family member 4 [Holothuria leucospilota]
MSVHTHGDFKYLTKDEWDQSQGKPIDKINFLNEDVAKPKFEKCANNYSLEVNRHLKSSDERDELRNVLLGKTGAGKSATGNTVLGFEAFRNEPDAVSVTAKSRCIRKAISGRNIKVMDTPGLHDTHKPNEEILKEIARVTKIFPEGVHAFLYVRNISDTRFTKEGMTALDIIEVGTSIDYLMLR